MEQLHRAGYCVAAISLRLDLPCDTVRAMLAKIEARNALRARRPENVRRAQRQRAEDKRAKALRLLQEADAVLES